MLLRRKYLNWIKPYYDSEQIKAITGVRRSGKSTIMRQIAEELSERVPRERIFYMDFEDFDAEIYLNDPHRFYDKIKLFVKGKEKCYVFLDEIHHMEGFERVLASIRSVLGCSVFVTSSSSDLLLGKLSTLLTGRFYQFKIQPLQYSEMLELTKQEDSERAFDTYMENGGFPLVYAEDMQNQHIYLKELLDSIIIRDIFKDKDIRNRSEFIRIASFILVHSGETISTARISGHIASIDDRISIQTCYKYIEYLEDCFIINKCPRYDIRGKALLDMKCKYYAVDSGLIAIQKGKASINKSFILETIIYNELVFRGYEVYTGKTYKGEVDFVVLSSNAKCYIQVCYYLADQEIIDREFSAFSSIKDHCPKYVLSLDRLDFSQEGIYHINIRDFLTGRIAIRLE